MTPLDGVLAGLGLLAATGVGALALSPLARPSQWIALLGTVAGGAIGGLAAVAALGSGETLTRSKPWGVPGGEFVVGLDPLSAFFLIPLFAFAPLAALFGRAYLAHHEPAARVARASGVLALLVAAMSLVVVARHALLFLVAWEAMTLLAYLLISIDHREPEVQRAGWTYLIASHVGVLALIGFFLALASHAGGALDFASIARATDFSRGALATLLALALVGFGIKAGVLGLHVWLPEAHAAAPSHVSALMSGVLVKLGIYGLLRVAQLLPVPSLAGSGLMALGIAGALVGIALALQQRDLKRALAYSTIENLGIILFGLGLGLWARSRELPMLAALGFAGTLLHVWNHCAIKGLLFLGAGSVLNAAGTKDLERLGGVLRRMPVTGGTMLLGAAAIAGLPPLNGFVGEWLLYRGLAVAAIQPMSGSGVVAIGAIAALAVVGSLAVLCFVRLAGIALLGQPRSEGALNAHEPGWGMRGPLAILGVACVSLGFAGPACASLIAPLVSELSGLPDAARTTRAALAPLARFAVLISGTSAVAWLVIARRSRGAASDDTWGCGYVVPTARMQYSASSFAELATHRLIPAWLRTPAERPRVEGIFPKPGMWSAQYGDPLTRSLYEPFLVRWGDRFSRLRFLQQGRLHLYLIYIAATAVLGVLWTTLRAGRTP